MNVLPIFELFITADSCQFSRFVLKKNNVSIFYLHFTGDFVLSQTPVICKYLGKKFGLYPDNEEDEFHADQVNITIHDFIAEGKSVFFF